MQSDRFPIYRPRDAMRADPVIWRSRVEAYRRSLAAFQRSIAVATHRRRAIVRPVPSTAATSQNVRPRQPALSASASLEGRLPTDAPSLTSVSTEAPPDWGPLSPREREIAALVALGHTNRQIARQLVLTEGTVANHVRRVLMRLGFESRAQIAAWVASDERRRGWSPQL